MASEFLKFDEGIMPYLGTFYPESDIQKELRISTSGMPEAIMQISPPQAALMQFIARLLRVSNYLEIGVFTGYSTLSMALAMPSGGRITACDISKEWTDIAKRYWEKAGVADRISLHLAPAVETLEYLLQKGREESFDMIFIDADKENYDRYYTLAKELLQPAGLILIDNTLWSGKVAADHFNDPETVAIRNLNLRIQKDPEVDAYLLPVGDGLTFVRKNTIP